MRNSGQSIDHQSPVWKPTQDLPSGTYHVVPTWGLYPTSLTPVLLLVIPLLPFPHLHLTNCSLIPLVGERPLLDHITTCATIFSNLRRSFHNICILSAAQDSAVVGSCVTFSIMPQFPQLSCDEKLHIFKGHLVMLFILTSPCDLCSMD